MIAKHLGKVLPIACVITFPTTGVLLAFSESVNVPVVMLRIGIISSITLIGILMLFVAFVGISEIMRDK